MYTTTSQPGAPRLRRPRRPRRRRAAEAAAAVGAAEDEAAAERRRAEHAGQRAVQGTELGQLDEPAAARAVHDSAGHRAVGRRRRRRRRCRRACTPSRSRPARGRNRRRSGSGPIRAIVPEMTDAEGAEQLRLAEEIGAHGQGAVRQSRAHPRREEAGGRIAAKTGAASPLGPRPRRSRKLEAVEGDMTQMHGEGGQDALNFPGRTDNQLLVALRRDHRPGAPDGLAGPRALQGSEAAGRRPAAALDDRAEGRRGGVQRRGHARPASSPIVVK